jgi:hypothetical protein
MKSKEPKGRFKGMNKRDKPKGWAKQKNQNGDEARGQANLWLNFDLNYKHM